MVDMREDTPLWSMKMRYAFPSITAMKNNAYASMLEQDDARSALAANNHELKKRRIAVTLADPRVRARHK